MSLWKIAWRSIQQRALASVLTAVSMGLGVALVVAVLVVHDVVRQSFRRGGEGFDLLVGDKGGELDLVLSSVFYMRRPVGNIPDSYRRELLEGRVYPQVTIEAAIPICLGHSYQDFPVIGTVPEMFEKLTYEDGSPVYRFAEGENFKPDSHDEVVIGFNVARETRKKLGDKLKAKHGTGPAAHEHEQEFTVVGILAHSGTPNDRALFINKDVIYAIHAHEAEDEHAHGEEGEAEDEHAHGEEAHVHEDHEHAHDDESRPVTALLVCLDKSSRPWTWSLQDAINKGPVARAVVPSSVISTFLRQVIGNIQLVLLIMAVLIVVVAGMGIMVSIYNSMTDRRHEIAVMRALGASRMTVMLVILVESILLSLGGGVLGLVLGHGLIGALSPIIFEQTQVAVGLLHFRPIELVLIPGLIVLASLVGYLPAVAAYRTDVARSLTTTP